MLAYLSNSPSHTPSTLSLPPCSSHAVLISISSLHHMLSPFLTQSLHFLECSLCPLPSHPLLPQIMAKFTGLLWLILHLKPRSSSYTPSLTFLGIFPHSISHHPVCFTLTLFHLDFSLWLQEENTKDKMLTLLTAERNTISFFLKQGSTQGAKRRSNI